MACHIHHRTLDPYLASCITDVPLGHRKHIEHRFHGLALHRHRYGRGRRDRGAREHLYPPGERCKTKGSSGSCDTGGRYLSNRFDIDDARRVPSSYHDQGYGRSDVQAARMDCQHHHDCLDNRSPYSHSYALLTVPALQTEAWKAA